MTDYIIATDSTTDLLPIQAEKYQIKMLPLSFNINGKDYYKLEEINDYMYKNFYDKIRQGEYVKTSQISPERFKNFFYTCFERGKDILYISFTSALSGTYNSAVVAANELKKQFPERKIKVVDSLCASLGEALLVLKAATKQQEGASLEEVTHYVESIKLNVNHLVLVDSLSYLKRSGRISNTKALVGTMLGIKPMIYVNNQGQLINFKNVRGRKQSIDKLLSHVEHQFSKDTFTKIFIGHADCKTDAEYVQSHLKKSLGVKDITINYLGPVVGAHAGPGTVAVFFMGQNRKVI